MSFRINTNLNAMAAQYYLNQTQGSYSQAVQRLSSGLQINSAADNAAGYAIAQTLQAQVNGLNQASSNAQDGISMVQTADGAMGQIESMVQTMRQLAVQASNDTLSSSDLSAINTQLQQLTSQVNLISTQTQYNGKTLLDGSLSTSINTATSGIQNGFVAVAGTNTSVSNVDVSQAQSATTYTFANASGKLTLSNGTQSQTIDLSGISVGAGGSYDLNFNQLGVNLTVSSVAGETGANIAGGLSGKTVITAAGSGSANLQIGANASDTMTVAFNQVNIGATGNAAMVALNTALNTFSGTQNSANAQSLITAVDGAINYLNNQQANLGAYQNRLQDSVANLGIDSQNTSASQSQIQDVNVAQEMVTFNKDQILLQTGVAVLAQANQAPNVALKLLQ